MNKIQTFSLSVILVALLGGMAVAQDNDVQFKPVSLASQFDFGQIVKGQIYSHEAIGANQKLKGNFFQRTGVWVTQEAIVKDRLDLKMGVGGLFWYSLPSDPTNAPSVLTQFGPGISQAQGTYTFGDLDKPAAVLQMGYFPYKYNPDAKNLGEYLLRSGVYPNYVVSGGWNMISSAAYMVQGFRLGTTFWNDRVNLDLLLPMEHDVPPMFDLSPTVVASVRPVAGVELGAGVDCNHCIPIKPSAEHPHVVANQVITGVSIDSSGVTWDSAGTTVTGNRPSANYAYSDGPFYYNYTRDSSSYYTFQGVKLIGRASFDPKAYISLPMLGAQDLKLYGEIAVLGVKNYDFLYDKITERMPVMVGFNLPTFKLLDVLSFELEYYNSSLPNSMNTPINSSLPIGDYLGGTGGVTQGDIDQFNSDIRNDNWKWSVYTTRTVTKGLQIYGQIASDHIRTINYNRGASPTYAPVTNRNGKDWYYLVRFEFGI